MFVQTFRNAAGSFVPYDGNRGIHQADEVMAHITANYLIRHLAQAGFVLMREPPSAAPTTAGVPPSIG